MPCYHSANIFKSKRIDAYYLGDVPLRTIVRNIDKDDMHI